MALTRITKGVIKPNENYDTHNINSTGIVTAIGLDVNGNGDISGNLSVGGVLTYEDVTSIDSVGLITARNGLNVSGGNVSIAGVSTLGGSIQNSVKILHNSGYGLRVERGGKYIDFNGDWGASGSTALNAGSSGIRFYYGDSSDGIQFNTGSGDDKVRITSDGKVGIGTDTPNGDLQIRAGQNANFRVLADPSTSGLFVGNYGSGDGYRSLSLLGSNILFHTITAGALSGAEERLRIQSDGLVGVGTETVRNNRTVQITGESGTTVLMTGFAPSIHFNGQSSTDSSNEDRSMLGQASGSNHMINGSSNGDTVLRGRGSGKLLVGMGSTVKMQLHDNGKFGLGTYPTTGVDLGFDVHIKKGSSEPSGQVIIQSHDTANATAGIQFLARRNDNVNETCRILATSDSGSKVNLRLYTDNNSNKGMRINGSDGGVSFVGSNTGTLGYTFQNGTANANGDVRVLIRTYSNQGADPYVKFDSGGTNHVVGQLYAGTTNNKLVLGAGESPSGGVAGIHIDSIGNVSVNTDGAALSGGGTFTVRSGSTAGRMILHGLSLIHI